MKKIIFTLIFLFNISISFGQINSNLILNKYSRAEGASSLKINNLCCAIAKPFCKELRDLKVKSIKILDLSDCNKEIKEDFNNTIRNNFDINKDIVLMYINDDNENVILLTNERKNKIVLLVTGEDPVLINVKAKVTKESIAKIMNYQNNN
ncbi:MAG: DUF4252 domain-containing protein [Bacteroidales bacterium]